jgi:hypothetical protein
LRLAAPALAPATRHDLFAKHAPGYFFNRDTHEKDLFAQAEVRARTARWGKLLGV